MTTSSRFQLDSGDFIRIGKGALLAAAGAAVAYLASELIPLLEGSTLFGGVLAAAASTLLNFVRKWLAEARPAER